MALINKIFSHVTKKKENKSEVKYVFFACVCLGISSLFPILSLSSALLDEKLKRKDILCFRLWSSG